MDFLSNLLRGSSEPATEPDAAAAFHNAWVSVQDTLLSPDERQLSRGIAHTAVPQHLKFMTDALVKESTQYEDSTGPCLEYLLKNDVLTTVVRLSEPDRPFGVQAEVLRTISNLVVLLDEKFLVHSAVHKAVIRLLQACVGDDIIEPTAGTGKVMGAAGSTSRVSPSEYEEDLVNLLCILCSRIRTYPELLMIFFHDKNWIHPRLFSPLGANRSLSGSEDEYEELDEGDEDDQTPSVTNEEKSTDESHSTDQNSPEGSEDAMESDTQSDVEDPSTDAELSATPTKHTIHLSREHERIRSAAPSPSSRGAPSAQSIPFTPPRPHYEFLIFNYLMRFIHREGAIGEFGRAGLLFLLDVAMSTQEMRGNTEGSSEDPVLDAATALADYILEGDFAEVLGAGLGAVYAQLPYKIELGISSSISMPRERGGGMELGAPVIGTVEEERAKAATEAERIESLGIEVSTNPEFRSRLDHFLKLVEFIEEVLHRVEITETVTSGLASSATVTGRAIAFAILESVRSIFLQNVLYPSLLECSEADGSAVAVMSYINTLLLDMHPGRLLNIFLDFLTTDGDGPSVAKSTRKSATSKGLRRRSSAMVLLSLEAPQSATGGVSDYFTSLGRFTLKDLLISNLEPPPTRDPAGQQTGIAALTLLHTLLTEQCHVSIDGILAVTLDHSATMTTIQPKRRTRDVYSDDSDDEFVYPGTEEAFPIDTNILQMPETTDATMSTIYKLYLNLIRKIDGQEVDDGFSTTFDRYLYDAVDNIQSHALSHNQSDAAPQSRHRLSPSDPLLKAVLQSLRNFFMHAPDYNVALSGVLVDISCCSNRSLAGWLTLAPNDELDSNAWSKQDFFGASGGRGDYDYEEDDLDHDDRSVDFAVDQKLRSENPTPSFDFRLRETKSMPVLYIILSGLVAQLDRYRMMVDDFDTLLKERKSGLLFSENLNDALSLVLDVETPMSSPAKTSQPAATPKASPPKKKSFVSSLLTPRKKSSPASNDADPVTPGRKPAGGAKEIPASPFAPHYQKTVSVDVEAFAAPPPTEGAWCPAERRSKVAPGLSFGQGGFGEADVFGFRSIDTVAEEVDEAPPEVESKTTTLSQLLDNVVILEESIKELTAIIQARISLGVDEVRYI